MGQPGMITTSDRSKGPGLASRSLPTAEDPRGYMSQRDFLSSNHCVQQVMYHVIHRNKHQFCLGHEVMQKVLHSTSPKQSI